MKIYHELLFGFLIIALLVAFVGGVSLHTNKKIASNIAQLAESSIDEFRGTTEMTSALQDLQFVIQQLITEKYRSTTSSLNTITSAKEKNIHSFNSSIERFEKWMSFSMQATIKGIDIASIMNEKKDILQEQAEIESLKAMTHQFFQYKKLLSQFSNLIQTDLNLAYTLKVTQLDPLYQKILIDVDELEKDSEYELTNRGKQIKNATQKANKILITAIISTLVLAFFLAITIAGIISKPLVQLSGAALKIGSGQHETRIKINRNDEIGILAKSFNHMANEVQTATQSLKNAASYNNNIVQSMQDTLLVLSSSGEIQRANRSSLKLLGYKEDELIGMSITQIAAKEGKPFSKEDIEHLLQSGYVRNTETTYATKDGHRLPMLFSGTTMHDETGAIEGVLCVAQDLSIKKIADAKIRESNEKLVKANKELVHTQSQLIHSAKLASVGELATGVAHELNQPLSIISMNADLRLSEVQDNDFSHVEESYELILKQVKRATVIINHLRTFGRDSNVLPYSPYSANQIIEDSFIMIAEQLRLNNINIAKDLSENLPVIHCNHIQIEQILTNLLMNAKDALEITENKLITVRSYEKNSYIVIEIEDTGSGIPESSLKKIFDPFYTSKEVGKGTGLGLSISYGIAVEHSGLLRVKSRQGEGSTFILELPTQRV